MDRRPQQSQRRAGVEGQGEGKKYQGCCKNEVLANEITKRVPVLDKVIVYMEIEIINNDDRNSIGEVLK